jgi:hypothetical protein
VFRRDDLKTPKKRSKEASILNDGSDGRNFGRWYSIGLSKVPVMEEVNGELKM